MTSGGHRSPHSRMTVSIRTTGRVGFYCYCCQPAPGESRVKERRRIKRRERQTWKREVTR